MGVLDKLKNAFFEVEYVEVEEEQKKEPKAVKKSRVHNEKPIAKKIVLPGKKEQKVEEIEEEELQDEDFEIRPMSDTIKEKKDEFKFMDDRDFQVDDDILEEPEIIRVTHPDENRKQEEVKRDTLVGKKVVEDEFLLEEVPPLEKKNRSMKPYGMDSSYQVPVPEYGVYEKKEERTYFKPSPIISPIYGILDKNYRKEDVKEKKDVRITSSYSRNVSVDEVRNKAYGPVENSSPSVESHFEIEEEEDNILVDLNDKEKPQVKELTVGDAVEYFQDLGLEYNVDYVDVSSGKSAISQPKKKKENEPVLESPSSVEETVEKETIEKDISDSEEPVVKEKVQEDVMDEVGENDNLFDLIDSMYQETD